MNFLERKAMKRAHQRLQLPPTVEVVDFDIARSSPGLHSVLGDAAVRAEQIDIICSTTGVHFQAIGQVAQVPWSSVVGFEAESGIFGTEYHFYLATSRRLSASVKSAVRGSFGDAVRSELTRYEKSLSEPDASRRSGEATRADNWKEEMLRRQTQVRAAGWKTNSSVKADLSLDDGSTMTGFVTLDQIGIFVEEEFGRRARVPFDTLGEFVPTESGALVSVCSLEDISQVAVRTDNNDVWLDQYEMRRQDWWI